MSWFAPQDADDAYKERRIWLAPSEDGPDVEHEDTTHVRGHRWRDTFGMLGEEIHFTSADQLLAAFKAKASVDRGFASFLMSFAGMHLMIVAICRSVGSPEGGFTPEQLWQLCSEHAADSTVSADGRNRAKQMRAILKWFWNDADTALLEGCCDRTVIDGYTSDEVSQLVSMLGQLTIQAKLCIGDAA